MTTKVEWHPYPEEKPSTNGLYLVTTNMCKKTYISIESFYEGEFLGTSVFRGIILAWAELPKTYDPEE